MDFNFGLTLIGTRYGIHGVAARGLWRPGQKLELPPPDSYCDSPFILIIHHGHMAVAYEYIQFAISETPKEQHCCVLIIL